jgi:hypothetical protein
MCLLIEKYYEGAIFYEKQFITPEEQLMGLCVDRSGAGSIRSEYLPAAWEARGEKGY